VPVIVFDFDKTLTYRDTLFGFYRSVSGKALSHPITFSYLVYPILHKLRGVSNDRLKQAGVALFLAGLNRQALMARARTYAATIKLNRIYREIFARTHQPVVASASFEALLTCLFQPPVTVVGATLRYNSRGEVEGLEQNCHGKQKVSRLNAIGITSIDRFYTDSFSDLAVMKISKEVYLVAGDSCKRI
jgi:phosphoserine phosphatase